MSEQTEQQQTSNQQEAIKGRSVFVVNTTPAGIQVGTALLTEDNKLLNLPAVFPDVEYALGQIEQLRQMVLQHFSQAARVGMQVLAAQQPASQEAAAPDDATRQH